MYLLFGVNSVKPYISCFRKIAEHGAQLDTHGVSFNSIIFVQDLLHPGNLFAIQVEVQGQTVNGGKISLTMNLQMTQHGIRDLADHHGLEGTGHGNKDQHSHYSKRDQNRGKKSPSLITQQVTSGKFEYIKHDCIP